ncbi:hypothetical protein DL546_005595 [Coniochaeta pulveracea]|uniref:PWI domain-containing protein n=1 Tax=Coniochaeta pulveracea TaxID=177199 RepID=A0A420Y395_9PEZI|nr:hypothetical protein DL546_005595 [Coniochaeta pulveracea]
MATGVDAKLLKTTKFPPEFNQKVDMTKVNLQVMKKWIAEKVTEILKSEDDVVIELIYNLIEGPRYPDIKSIQIQLTGFLDKDTPAFCKELWKLFLSAQDSPQGVPKELLEAKKLELIQEKIEAEKAAEEARLRREQFERRGRGRDGPRGGRGGDSWRGGRRDDRDRDFGGPRGRGGFGRSGGRSPSPPRYRDSAGGRRGGRDTYERRHPAEKPISRAFADTVAFHALGIIRVPVQKFEQIGQPANAAPCIPGKRRSQAIENTAAEVTTWWPQPLGFFPQISISHRPRSSHKEPSTEPRQKSTQQVANEQREKELKEQIKQKMRSSKSD